MSRSTVTILWLVMVVVTLAAGDKFLARVESSEIAASARRAFAKGSMLQRAGDMEDAIDSLREAHGLARDNTEYSLALVSALTTAGKTAEAEPLLNEVLQRRPNDGPANLAAARLRRRTADLSDALAYYHRAIYGNWGEDADPKRRAVRMELVHLLVEKNRRQELLAELITLEAEGVSDSAFQKHLAQLFIAADSPARAADIYRALTERDPKDLEADEGLGRAELQLGQYRAAHAAYERAFLHDPNNAAVREHLEVLNTVTGLDPTIRQLTSAEKYRRSLRILSMTRDALAQCGRKSGSADDLLKAADADLSGNALPHVTNEAAESILSLAENLWREEQKCAPASAEDANPLALLMRKLAS